MERQKVVVEDKENFSEEEFREEEFREAIKNLFSGLSKHRARDLAYRLPNPSTAKGRQNCR